jgi:hypothetical protein
MTNGVANVRSQLSYKTFQPFCLETIGGTRIRVAKAEWFHEVSKTIYRRNCRLLGPVSQIFLGGGYRYGGRGYYGGGFRPVSFIAGYAAGVYNSQYPY